MFPFWPGLNSVPFALKLFTSSLHSFPKTFCVDGAPLKRDRDGQWHRVHLYLSLQLPMQTGPSNATVLHDPGIPSSRHAKATSRSRGGLLFPLTRFGQTVQRLASRPPATNLFYMAHGVEPILPFDITFAPPSLSPTLLPNSRPPA